MARRIGYLRVSTHEQKPDRQLFGLEALCDEMHVERLSAVARHRPVYETIVSSLECGDTFVVWDLDRAFRSTIDAITEAERLRSRGIEFQIVNLQVDTATPAGMLVYTVMSAFAEFERGMLRQRTREGLAAARKRGKRLGRPSKLSEEDIASARFRVKEMSETLEAVAPDFNVSPITLSRALKREGVEACCQDAAPPQ